MQCVFGRANLHVRFEAEVRQFVGLRNVVCLSVTLVRRLPCPTPRSQSGLATEVSALALLGAARFRESRAPGTRPV